jgi:transcriptional regulator with XRE-family HTH domain
VFELPQVRKLTKSKPPKRHRNPVIVAQEWQEILNRENYTPADLARKLGVSRARVAQVLRLLRLAPDLLRQIAALGDYLSSPIITERMLRPIVDLSLREQEHYVTAILRRNNSRQQYFEVMPVVSEGY